MKEACAVLQRKSADVSGLATNIDQARTDLAAENAAFAAQNQAWHGAMHQRRLQRAPVCRLSADTSSLAISRDDTFQVRTGI